MKILIVASDLMYPPKGGVYEMTLLMIKALNSKFDKVDLLSFTTSDKLPQSNDVEGFVGELNVCKFFKSKRSWVYQGLRFCYFPDIILNKDELFIKSYMQDNEYDAIVFEGVGTSGLVKFSQAKKNIVNVIDPPSRRYFRFLEFSNSFADKLALTLKGLMSFVLERSINSDDVVFNTVSCEDSLYLKKVHHTCQNSSVSVCLSEMPTYKWIGFGSNKIIVFIDLSVGYLVDSLVSFFNDVLLNYLSDNDDVVVDILCRVNPNQSIIDMCKNYSINFVTWVDDISAAITQAAVIVIPDLVGTGIKNRAIFSLGHGVPVIGTDIAFEGIPIEDGIDAIVYNSPTHFVSSLDKVLRCTDFANKLSLNSKSFVAEKYSYGSFKSDWSTLIGGAN